MAHGWRFGRRAPWSRPRLSDWWFRVNPLAAELRWREERAILREVGGLIHPDQRLIELGCGGGWYTISLARNCASLTAIDRSAAMLEYLEVRLFREGIANVRVQHADAPACLARMDPADGIVACGFFDYVPDLPGALRMIAGALRPGGWLVATVPIATPAGAGAAVLGSVVGKDTYPVAPDAVRESLEASGFTGIQMTPVGLTRVSRTLVLRAVTPEAPRL